MRTYLSVFLLLLAVALAQQPTGQTCYTIQSQSSGSTNCQAPPYYTAVYIEPPGICDYSICVPNTTLNGRGVAGDYQERQTNDFNAIPRPRKYVQLTYYSDVQCLNPSRIEFLTDSPCGVETSFYATCNQTHARVIRYYNGCNYVSSDFTYPLNQCSGGPTEFVTASCGTSTGSTPPSTSPAPVPSPSYTPRTYTPSTPLAIRSTPLTCYYNVGFTNVILYNVTYQEYVCARYDYTCPANTYNYTNYCTEGSTVTIHTWTSRDTCTSIKQLPQYYRNAVCCETNYCNGDQTPNVNVSIAVTLVPSLFTSLTLTWLVSVVAFLPRMFMNK